MKKFSFLLLVILISSFVFGGCGYVRHLLEQTTNENDELYIDENTVYADWGEYRIPDGWQFSEEYTSKQDMEAGKLFFENEQTMNDPNIYTNISVEHGINRYPQNEHERFRDAILKQLLSQIEGGKAQLTGDGSYTDNGYILYKFTIEEEDEDITTVQYYIIGDKEYVLVHLTDYHEQSGDDASGAAYEFAQSVVWNNYGD